MMVPDAQVAQESPAMAQAQQATSAAAAISAEVIGSDQTQHVRRFRELLTMRLSRPEMSAELDHSIRQLDMQFPNSKKLYNKTTCR